MCYVYDRYDVGMIMRVYSYWYYVSIGWYDADYNMCIYSLWWIFSNMIIGIVWYGIGIRLWILVYIVWWYVIGMVRLRDVGR